MNAIDAVNKETKELTNDLKGMYGTPEVVLTEARLIRCEHYYVRKSPTVFGCNKCTNHWVDNGEFKFRDGKFLSYDTTHKITPKLPIEK